MPDSGRISSSAAAGLLDGLKFQTIVKHYVFVQGVSCDQVPHVFLTYPRMRETGWRGRLFRHDAKNKSADSTNTSLRSAVNAAGGNKVKGNRYGFDK
jgi:hypothetical protein